MIRTSLHKSLILIPLVFLALLLAGCGSSKKSGKSNEYSPETGSVTPGAVSTDDCRQVLANYGLWQRLKTPVTLRLYSPKSVSISGNAVMERGKSIMISLRFLGMEIGSLYVTNDSIQIIDKFNKRYVKEPLAQLLAGFPVNISNVQDLLLGRPFLLGSKRPVADMPGKFDITADSNTLWMLIPKSSPAGMDYGFSFSPVECLAGIIIKAGQHKPVSVTYSGQTETVCGPMASETKIEATAGKNEIDAVIEWNFKKARWGSQVSTEPPSLPRNAERIPASKILKSISTLQ